MSRKIETTNDATTNVETTTKTVVFMDQRMREKLTRYNALRVSNELETIDAWHGSHASLDMAIHELSPRSTTSHGRSTFAQYLRDNGIDEKYGRRVLRANGFNAPYEQKNHANYVRVINGEKPSSIEWN